MIQLVRGSAGNSVCTDFSVAYVAQLATWLCDQSPLVEVQLQQGLSCECRRVKNTAIDAGNGVWVETLQARGASWQEQRELKVSTWATDTKHLTV